MRFQTKAVFVVSTLVAWTQLPCPATAGEPEKVTGESGVRESLKFDPAAGPIVIPVRVGAADYPFMVDTGCTFSVFDVFLRAQLGPRVDATEVQAPNGIVEMDRYSAPAASVGSLPFTEGPVFCHDFTLFREASGCNLRGCVGMDFLRRWIVRVDFDKSRLQFLSPGAPSASDWGEAIPITYDSQDSPQVLAAIGNGYTPFRIDTGFDDTGDLADWLFSGLVASRAVRITGNRRSATAAGDRSVPVGRLSDLSVGPFRHQNLRLSMGTNNVLGIGYLRRYRVTIDFPNQRIYLAKGKGFADRDRGQMCGMQYLFRPKGIELETIAEGSPAGVAGVHAKDILLSLNGKQVRELRPAAISRLLTDEGKPVRVTVERAGKRMDFRFTPKEFD